VKIALAAHFHSFGVARQGPWITGVKIALAAHFHGFGVARQGPWITWVNRAKREGRGFWVPAQCARDLSLVFG
jgi:hypothetical protein